MIVVFPSVLFAAGDSNLNPLGSVNNLWDLLKNIFTALIDLAIPVAILYLVYSGYLFVTAGGDEKQINTAKENFKWTVVGIAVLLGARALVDMLKATITGLNP